MFGQHEWILNICRQVTWSLKQYGIDVMLDPFHVYVYGGGWGVGVGIGSCEKVALQYPYLNK